jgi:GNAT superfamily N-acetyltransferase
MIRKLGPGEHMAHLFKGFERDSKFVKIDPEYADKTYKDLIDRGAGEIFLLFDDETGNLMGGLGCIKAPDMWTGDLIAIETFWYVLPEYRSGLQGAELLFAFEQWAVDEGCKKIAIIHLADSHPDRLDRLYHTLGYQLVEKHFVKEV